MILVQAAVEGPRQRLIHVNACVVVQPIEHKIVIAFLRVEGAIKNVAVRLIQVLHRQQMIGAHSCAKVAPQHSGLCELHRGNRYRRIDSRHRRRRDAGRLGNHVAEERVLGRQPTAFVQRRVVVVAGRVWLVVLAVAVGAVHPAKAGPAVKHVDAHGESLLQHPRQFVGLLLCVCRVVLFAPVIEPSRPVFAVHERTVGTKFVELSEIVLRSAGTEIDHRRKFGQGAVGQLIGAIGCVEQRLRESCIDQVLVNLLHVGVVLSKGPVLVLHLHSDNRPAVRNLQRRQFFAQPQEPAANRIHELLVAAPDNNVVVLQQPRRIPAPLPLRAHIRTGPQNHVEPLALRLANELRYVVLTAEVVHAWAWLVNVPEYVGRDRVQPHRLGHAQPRTPVGTGNARVVYLPGDDAEGLPVEKELAAFRTERVGRGRLCCCGNNERSSKNEERKKLEDVSHGMEVAEYESGHVSFSNRRNPEG